MVDVKLNKFLEMLGQVVAFDITADLNFAGDVCRDIPRPMLKGIEGDDARWIVKLPRQEVGDGALYVRPLDFGFTV